MTDQQFITNNEKEIIFEGEGSGRFGIIINGKMRLITPERSAQACLYKLAKQTVHTDLFDNIPKGLPF
jgi:hypothetical protein